MAAKAEYLRRANKRTVWQAAIFSSILAAILTIAIAFAAAYLTGSVAQEDTMARFTKEILTTVNQARLTGCINARESIRLLVQEEGPPYIASVQNCDKLPKVEYDFYRQKGYRNES